MHNTIKGARVMGVIFGKKCDGHTSHLLKVWIKRGLKHIYNNVKPLSDKNSNMKEP